MSESKKTKLIYISIFSVIAFVIISWLAISVTKNMLTQKRLQKNSSDFFMKGVDYTQIAEDGSIQNQMQSNQIIHYPVNDTYVFSSPHMTMLDADKHPWKITADHGIGKNNGQEIYLWDNVNITQPIVGTGAQQNAMQVVTSSATIYPQQKKAYTDKPLTIMQAGTLVHAVGAQVDFSTSTVKLLSKVQGQYAQSDGNKK